MAAATLFSLTGSVEQAKGSVMTRWFDRAHRHTTYWLAVALLSLCSSGCWSASSSDVVVYAALDREFSEPILDSESKAVQVRALPVYDLESTKTLGLVTRIESERSNPGCDLFWNNEILHTVRLAQQGLLRPLRLPSEVISAFPELYRDPNGQWIGFAARARVLLINKRLLPNPEQWPSRVADLVDPNRQEARAMAKPTFGTTATHMAVLHHAMGDERFNAFLDQVFDAVTIVSGNKQVATGVAQGDFAWGLTDTDDAVIEVERSSDLIMVFPDQNTDEAGALLIPNTLCSPAGAPHAEQADRLIERLLTPEVESRLAAGPSAQIPMHASIRDQSRVFDQRDQPPRWMNVDWAAAALKWPATKELLIERLHESP